MRKVLFICKNDAIELRYDFPAARRVLKIIFTRKAQDQ